MAICIDHHTRVLFGECVMVKLPAGKMFNVRGTDPCKFSVGGNVSSTIQLHY
jgi:hypothetical protein